MAAVNQPPVAVDDAVAHMADIFSFVINVLDNDSDPDGDSLRIASVGPASKGSVTASGFQLFYSPRTNQLGEDSFTYTVSDGRGGTATGTVTLSLYEPLPAPADVSGSTSPGSFALTWSAVTGASSYRVSRNGFPIATSTTTSWTDTGLDDRGGYRYWVEALDNLGREGFASYPEVHRQPRPRPPVWLHVDQTGDGASLELTWDSAGEGYGFWRVWRDGAAIATTPVAKYVDTGLVEGTPHSYQVSRVTELESLLSAPVSVTPALSDIRKFYRDHSGDLGPVTVPERFIPDGRQQDHQNGLILQWGNRTPLAVTNPLATAYLGEGGATGDLGFPIDAQETGLRDGGSGQLFQGGSIWNTGPDQTWVVYQLIEDGWARIGWEEGPLGYPVDDLVELDGGFAQAFEGGDVYWSEATGSHGVRGRIYGRWAATGYEDGVLGYPTSDEIALRKGGRYQKFQGGDVYWAASTGAWAVRGAILTAWTRAGSANGRLGYPRTDAIALRNGGRYQKFRGGDVYWAASTGAWAVRGAILAAWARTGSVNGRLGYPRTDETGTASKRRQTFQGGTITVDVATGRSTITYR
jgi:hypothetical protein